MSSKLHRKNFLNTCTYDVLNTYIYYVIIINVDTSSVKVIIIITAFCIFFSTVMYIIINASIIMSPSFGHRAFLPV